MNPPAPSSPVNQSAIARLYRKVAAVEGEEVRAVTLSILYFFFLLAATQSSSQCAMLWALFMGSITCRSFLR